MKTWEKLYSLFAIIFSAAFITLLILLPQYRQIKILLPLSFLGLISNIIFMFLVFRDIFFRKFNNPNQKYIWFALILFLWPSVLIYLPKYGFKSRDDDQGL